VTDAPPWPIVRLATLPSRVWPIGVASCFLRFLDKNHVPVESAQPEHVHAYLREALRIYPPNCGSLASDPVDRHL
jgi:hypothetical protein